MLVNGKNFSGDESGTVDPETITYYDDDDDDV